jgi:hypothetical protein
VAGGGRTISVDKMSQPAGKERTRNFKKVNEQPGNLYENKGPAFSSTDRSGNVTENKGSYALKAGMLLKRQVVRRCGNQ